MLFKVVDKNQSQQMSEGGVDKGGDRCQGDDFCSKIDPCGRIVDDSGVGRQECCGSNSIPTKRCGK